MRQLSAIDASWFQMDEPGNAADITVLLEFEHDISREEIDRLLLVPLVERYPRFQQRVVRSGLSLYWERDPDFHLDRHVAEATVVRAGGALQELIGTVASDPLPEDRPLWNLTLVHDPDGGCAAVVRIHHCLGDGFGLGAAFLRMFGRSPAGEPQLAAPSEPSMSEPVSLSERIVHEIHALQDKPGRAEEVVDLGGRLAKSVGHLLLMPFDPETPLHGEVTGERRVAWTEGIALERIKRIGSAMGATINDTLMTAISGAIRAWLERSEIDDVPDIRAMVPVNLRPARSLDEVADDLGNMFGLVILDLFTAEADPHRRLEKLKAAMDELKQSADALVAFGILLLEGRSPAVIEHLVTHLFARKASVVITNVPGPREPLYLGTNRVENVLFWVPHPGTFGLGFSIASYNGVVRVGVRSDANVVPEPAELAALFEEQLDALEAVETQRS